jgi:membrane associated rhomboid family serine protease
MEQHRRVDPAALLVAVLAVGFNPLMGEGEWGAFSMFPPLVVLVVLCAFTLTEEPRRSLQTRFLCVAVALVIGLIAGVALAGPAQEIFGGNADWGSWGGQGGGLVVAAIVAWFLIRDMNRRKRKPESPADSPAEKATAPHPQPPSK